jgi:hypothetical protein
MDDGKITINTATDESSYIYRDQAITTTPVFELKEDHADGDKEALLVTHDPTADIDAVKIVTAGTGYGITIQPAAAGGKGVEVITAAGTGPAFLADGATGGAAWVGAAATGLIQAQSDGALANVAASLVYLAYSGNAGGANQTGSCINVVETGAASGTSYAVGIATTNNNGASISTAATGKVALYAAGGSGHTAKVIDVDGTAGANGWIGAASTGMVHLASDGVLANASASLLYSTYTGNAGGVNMTGVCGNFVEGGAASGTSFAVNVASTNNNGLSVSAAAAKNAVVVSTITQATASLVKIDGTTGDGWYGAANVGMLNIATDGALADVASTPVLISSTGTGQAAHMGTSMRIVDTCNAGAGSYAVYLSATDADVEALKVDNGKVVVDETVTASEGFITLVNTKDVSVPPADAELNAADGLNWDSGGTTGQFAFVDKNNAHTNIYLVMLDAAGDYWYVALTKAV